MFRIVIADDEPIIKMDVREILELNGYSVVGEASDGVEAIEVCRNTLPDLVLMDIKMPVLDGLKAVEIIHEQKLARCVLMLTAYNEKSMLEQAKNADVMGYLIKPVDENSLIPAIEIALAKQSKIEKMNREFEKTRTALESRKYIDRAKGILMETKKMSELEAYSYMRKVAMDQECTIARIAQTIILSYR